MPTPIELPEIVRPAPCFLARPIFFLAELGLRRLDPVKAECHDGGDGSGTFSLSELDERLVTVEQEQDLPDSAEDTVVESGELKVGDREPDIQRILDQLVLSSSASPTRPSSSARPILLGGCNLERGPHFAKVLICALRSVSSATTFSLVPDLSAWAS